MKSLSEELMDYLVLQQRIEQEMCEGKLPNQSMELNAMDTAIHAAIIHAKSYMIKIKCVNKSAFEQGQEKANNGNSTAIGEDNNG